jgi:iron-sulfur cluster repair protein YtfE (RIC family)
MRPGRCSPSEAGRRRTTFKRRLIVHHIVEDEALWPRVEAASAGRSGGGEILAAMAAEHGRLDSLLEAVDTAMAQRSAALPEIAAGLEAGLEDHMRHEEEATLPLIQEVLEPRDWAEFGKAVARKQQLSGVAATCRGSSTAPPPSSAPRSSTCCRPWCRSSPGRLR